MKLDDVHTRYAEASAKSSEVARQLAFAGIAVVWLFSGGKIDQKTGLHVPGHLLWAGALLVAALTLDFFHAAYRAASLGVFARIKEKDAAIDRDAEIDFPRWINWPSIGCFWGKLACVGFAYCLLASYFIGQLH